MNFRFQFRRGTSAQWAAANPVLAAGEPGVDLDTGEQRIGDGITAWADLTAAAGGSLTGVGVSTVWAGSQAAYDAIGTPDPNTLYFVTG